MLCLIKKLFQRQPEPIIAHVPIAGLRYYRAEALSNLMQRGDELDLRLEPNNPHDPNAIMIFWHQNKIGYVPSASAEQLQTLLKQYRNIAGKIIAIDPESGEQRWVKLNIYPST